MTRPLRIDVDGGWYHITARGNNRQTIFTDRRDHEHFQELLKEVVERFGVEIHTFVLMGNHYHLLIRTPEANASQAIQWLNISYSVWWNRRHGRCGHVFQGRFKSVLVESSAWALELSLYIHFNPLAVKGLGLSKREKKAEGLGLSNPSPELVERRLEVLRTYAWSSFHGYTGYAPVPCWLATGELLGRVKGGRDGYRKMAEARLKQGAEESLWGKLRWGYVLGSERFAEKVRAGLKPGREDHGRSLMRERRTWEEIVSGVEKAKGERWAVFSQRHGDWGRDLALWLARRRSGMTLREIGEKANGMDYTAVAMAVKRFANHMEQNKTLRRLARELENSE